MDPLPYKEKTTLPWPSTDVSGFVCVTAFTPFGAVTVLRFGNINPIPFRETPGLSKLFRI